MGKLPKDFVVTAFIVKGEEVLLVMHKKLGMWLPIGGHIELNEDLEEALEREIEEEAGVKVDVIAERRVDCELEGVRSLPIPAQVQVEFIDEKHEHIDLIYFAKYLEGEEKLADSEHDEIRWFHVSEIEEDKKGIFNGNVKALALKAVKAINALE